MEKDRHFNTLPISVWDRASGFICNGEDVIHIGSPLTHLYHSKGVNTYSNSTGVCILKECAREMVERAKEVRQ